MINRRITATVLSLTFLKFVPLSSADFLCYCTSSHLAEKQNQVNGSCYMNSGTICIEMYCTAISSRGGSVSVFGFGRFFKSRCPFWFFKTLRYRFRFFHMNFLCLTVSQLSLLGRSKICDVIAVSPNAQQFETGSCLWWDVVWGWNWLGVIGEHYSAINIPVTIVNVSLSSTLN